MIIPRSGEFNTLTAFSHGEIDQELHHLASKPAVLELVEYADAQQGNAFVDAPEEEVPHETIAIENSEQIVVAVFRAGRALATVVLS